MLGNVPDATVVITNPTHLAIAIRYDRDATGAPVVLAKGSQYLAKTIVRIAKEHDIPVLERKPLARALYKMVEVDQESQWSFIAPWPKSWPMSTSAADKCNDCG